MSAKDIVEPTPEDWLAGADEEFVVDQKISHPDRIRGQMAPICHLGSPRKRPGAEYRSPLFPDWRALPDTGASQ